MNPGKLPTSASCSLVIDTELSMTNRKSTLLHPAALSSSGSLVPGSSRPSISSSSPASALVSGGACASSTDVHPDSTQSTKTHDSAFGDLEPIISSRLLYVVAARAFENTPAQLTATVSGTAPITYQWQRELNGNYVNVANTATISGANTATLTVTGYDASDAGDYRCAVTTPYGVIYSSPATLAVRQATTITQQPVAHDVCSGGNTTFSVTAIGDGTLSYQWQKNMSNLSNGGHYSGVTTATLTITGAQPEEKGACRDITFDPTILPDGVALSDDPLLPARSAAYSSSFQRRALETPGPSAVGKTLAAKAAR